MIITAAGTALATTLAAKTIEAPINTFNALWDGILGYRISAWAEKKRLMHYQNVELFKQDLADELNTIPHEFVQDPKLSIVGPALEASTYYFEEEDLRKMFAKLIASSMDSRLNGYVQHSFVEIIRQLTPLDANIIKRYTRQLPIANLALKNQKGSSSVIYPDFYLSSNFPDISMNSISLNNLHRLGLLKIEYDKWLTKDDEYDYIEKSAEYSKLDSYIAMFSTRGDNRTKDIQKGIVTLTSFGSAFKKVCID